MPFNFDLFTVGVAIAGNLILGFVVFFARKKSATSVLFLLLTFALSAWSLVNYFSYKASSLESALLLVRLVLFFAVPIGMLFLFFAETFPGDKFVVKKRSSSLIIAYSALAMCLTLTPYVFKSVALTEGAAPLPVVAPGIIVFIIIPVLAIFFGIARFIYRTYKAKPDERRPYRYLLSGLLAMFGLIILFDFIFPVVLKNTRLIPLSAIFTLPFVGLTAYAIFRHHLLNMKIVATEVLTFALATATATQLIFSNSLTVLLFNSSIVLLVVGVGIQLIRSVRNEIQQREQLEVLSKQLSEANTQLQALDKARAEFISIASHQLRTPPATIKWYVGAVMDGDFGQLTPELKAVLERVESTNNSQISLIDDLLNASRIERGKLEFFFEMGDLEPLAKMTYEQLIPQATMHKLELKYEPPAKPLPKIMLDKEKVRQVINNFIDNAIKYTKQGSVTVHFDQTDKDVILKVTDTGRGVAPDVAPTLFEKYTRGKDAASAASGLGLGLYVAKVVIEQNNGKIWVESPGEGKGSTFAFSLPIKNTLHETSSVDLSKDQQITGSVEAAPSNA